MLGSVAAAKYSSKFCLVCSSKTRTAKNKWLIGFALLGRKNLKKAGVQTCSRILATVKSTEKAWPNLSFSWTASEFNYVEVEKGEILDIPSRHALTYPDSFQGFLGSQFWRSIVLWKKKEVDKTFFRENVCRIGVWITGWHTIFSLLLPIGF